MGAAWPASDKRTLNQLGDVCLSCLKRGPRRTRAAVRMIVDTVGGFSKFLT